MTEGVGVVVVVAVLLARFLVPLSIPRYPVPGIIACLVLDAVDQTIFQQVPEAELDGYQQYDKALDIYYLSIAYFSTLRNWSDPFAFGVVRFLFYYRLVGVVLFEFTEPRWVLVVFPNTFEYFFIAYELFRMRWSPHRLTHRTLVLLAASIWIVIKLPQEWWLHIAELDVTDELKTRVFGVDVSAGWGSAVTHRPWVLLVVAAVGLACAVALRRVVRGLPPGDWPVGVDVDRRARGGQITRAPASLRARQRMFVRGPLIEKVTLVSMVTVIFAQILPGVRATTMQLVVSVAIIVIANSAATQWVAIRGVRWTSTATQFGVVVAINLVIVFVLALLPSPGGASIDVLPALFFLLMLSLLVTLYDRFRMLRSLRRAAGSLR